jgi:hypothetical protein
MTSKDRVFEEAIKIVGATESGVRYSALVRALKTKLPDIPANTIHGSLHSFRNNLPEEIYMPAKGLYRHIRFGKAGEEVPRRGKAPVQKADEEQFYGFFAEWLVNELEECTRAIALGGSKFKDKWGTPDVIGVREPKKSDIIKPPTEIIAAEVKTDTQALITAFGQACAYRLFSHRSYIVVPDDSADEDITRLDALARIFGIGLILFDRKKKDAQFEIRVRAARHEPDMFYVNKYLKMIEDDLFA